MPDAEHVAVAVVVCGDRVLAGPRPEGSALAGYWEFPGGKLIAGETAEEAAVRECLEETGLQVQILRALDRRLHHYRHGPVLLNFFLAKPVSLTSQPRPPFRWVDLEFLKRQATPPANAHVLRMLAALVRPSQGVTGATTHPDQEDGDVGPRRL